MSVKYATIRKINVSNASQNESDVKESENNDVLVVPIPTSESFSVTKVNPAKPVDIKRYNSFSSNESGSSIASSVRVKKADVSLTSGEISSLSSQAESEHYETDGNVTDVEGPRKTVYEKAKQVRRTGSRVDSGFDSGSMSSGMSNRSGYQKGQSSGTTNHAMGSWARNYKMAEPISSSPAYFGSKFLPPHESVPEEHSSTGYDQQSESTYKDNDSGIIVNNRPSSKGTNMTNRNPKPISNKRFEDTDKSFTISPDSKYAEPHTRALSPANRMKSPIPNYTGQVTVKHSSRPMSPSARKPERPMSPNVQPTGRPMSPLARVTSPTPRVSSSGRPMSPNVQPTENKPRGSNANQSRPMSPLAYKTSRPTSLSPSRDGYRVLSPSERRSKSSDHYQSRAHKNKEDKVGIGSSSDTSSNAAAKRYRELVKQGVPLRATSVDDAPTEKANPNPDIVVRPGTAESTIEEPVDDQMLFADLESKGFFNTRSRSPSPHKGSSPKRLPNPHAVGSKDTKPRESRSKRKKIPLDQIVREKPESKSSGRKPFRSSSNQHLTVSEEAFLNQPTSEDSETCSIKTNKSNSSTPSGSKPKVMVDAEMVIDRIFSQNNPGDYELDVEVEAALGLDKDPFKSLPEMYGNFKDKDRVPNLDNIPLLNGVDDRHIHGCMELASTLHVVTMRDLLPAIKDNFDVLRNKLQQVGQLGTVGNQLLDIISKCWLLDMPPTSGDLVEQLTDPVTETEL